MTKKNKESLAKAREVLREKYQAKLNQQVGNMTFTITRGSRTISFDV